MVLESPDCTTDESSRTKDSKRRSRWTSFLFPSRSAADEDAAVNATASTPSPQPASSLLPPSTTLLRQDEEEDEDGPNGEVAVLHDLLAGGVAGSASVIVGHPFDTLKVRLQTSSASGASLASLASSFGGVSSLFRGMGAPLVSASAVNAVIFSAYGTSSRYWDDYVSGNAGSTSTCVNEEVTRIEAITADTASHTEKQRRRQDEEETHHDSWQKAFACGSFAGLVQCCVICPTEHVKCRLQIQHGKGSADHVFKGPLQACVKIVREYGISGLYRGWAVTAWREVPAFGLYFSVYDYAKDEISSRLADQAGLDIDKDDVPHSHLWLSSALAGGMSGSLTWAVIYPLDVVKSHIQTSPLDAPLAERRIATVGAQLVHQHGWRFLFRGLGITLIRAFPVNGIIFPVYEFTLLHLSGELNGSGDATASS